MKINVVCVKGLCVLFGLNLTQASQMYLCSRFGVSDISITKHLLSSPAVPAGGGKRVAVQRAGGCRREAPVGEQ